MDVQTWKGIWHVVLVVSNLAFYAVVLVVAVKGMADVKEMVAKMLSGRSASNGGPPAGE